MTKTCLSCNDLFTPCRNVPCQQYCKKPSCQRFRRSQWQRQKLLQDADYRDNQARARQHWRESHRGYMVGYRATHPVYCVKDRQQRAQRRQRKIETTGHAVNMDEYPVQDIPKSGTYRMNLVNTSNAVNMDEYYVQLVVITRDKVFDFAP